MKVVAVNFFAWSVMYHDLGGYWQIYVLKVWFFKFHGALLDISHHPRFGWSVMVLFIPILRNV